MYMLLQWSRSFGLTIDIESEEGTYLSELSLEGVLGVLYHPQNLEVLLTLFQPEGADYVHHITASTPALDLKT